MERPVVSVKHQILDAFAHNIAQFQMQAKQETDPAKQAALEELLVQEKAKHEAMSRSLNAFAARR